MGIWLLAGIFAAPLAGVKTRPDAAGIVNLSAAANDRDWAAASNYSYMERDRTGHATKTYQVRMILGSPYQKLTAVNGQPLSAEEQAEAERKLAHEIEQRRNETPTQRQSRIAAYRQGRRRDHLLITQLVSAFNFKLLGEQTLAGHRVYVLDARPRPDYIPPDRDTKVLTGMQGKLWIDRATYQWVRVVARVIRPVWIEGFLARVDPGTRFALDYAPVNADIWLPTHFVMSSHAKVLFVFSRHEEADQTYFDYQPQTAVQATSNGSNSSTR